MKDDLKKQIDNTPIAEGFIKVTDSPVTGILPEQKVALNRKGNELFNSGKIDQAKRIFITTGYSDGLTRVGCVYEEENKEIDALKMFLLAHNKKKSDHILEKAASVISELLKE